MLDYKYEFLWYLSCSFLKAGLRCSEDWIKEPFRDEGIELKNYLLNSKNLNNLFGLCGGFPMKFEGSPRLCGVGLGWLAYFEAVFD